MVVLYCKTKLKKKIFFFFWKNDCVFLQNISYLQEKNYMEKKFFFIGTNITENVKK